MVGARGWRKAGVVLIFLAPSLVALLAFSLGPMVGTAWVSLTEWNLIRSPRFIGLANYRELWSDEQFHRALTNTLYYLVGYIPLVTVGGLGLAVLLNKRLRFVGLFRALYFLPVVTSWVVVFAAVEVAAPPARTGSSTGRWGLVGIDGPGVVDVADMGHAFRPSWLRSGRTSAS